MAHEFDKNGNCRDCCCGDTECVKCGEKAHSLGVVDEMYNEETGDCWWIHEYECFKCGEVFSQ